MMDGDLKDELAQLPKKPEWEEQLAQLHKKVEEQFRFTRNLIVLCTLVNLGLLIFTMLSLFQTLPSQVNAHFMSNLEPIVIMWRQYNAIQESQDVLRRESVKANPAPGASPAPTQ
ncbi:MAG: hypothetical protein K2X93_19915 [Candidatus Obscuribacterales bacterium]|nr:hypothetical protein [Candidatus Obscuribacterales bacterium]